MKQRISILSTLFLMLALTACGTNRDATSPGAGPAEQLRLADFNAIENSAVVTIRLIAGSRISVKAENYEPKVDHISIKGQTLCIGSYPTKRKNTQKRRLILTITAPHLKAIRNAGVMDLDAEKWKCANLQLLNAGVADINFRHISCDLLSYSNSGVITFHCSGDARKAKLSNSGQSHCQMDLTSDNLWISNSGVENMQVHFKGAAIDIRNNGKGNIRADVDCTRLTASNGGIGDFEITGTADNTKIDTKGQAHITTKNLNKF